MGQKVHPGGLRVGVIHDWKSNWMVGKKEFAGAILEDIKIRDHILGKLAHAGLSDILIRKDKQRITVDIYTARPGIVIGKRGAGIESVKKDLQKYTSNEVFLNIVEVRKAEIDAMLERLKNLSDDHFGFGPQEVHWGHVGQLADYASLLRRITDSAFNEGEHLK